MMNDFKTRYIAYIIFFHLILFPSYLLVCSILPVKFLPVIIYKYILPIDIPSINKGIFFLTLSNTSNIEKQISNLNPPLRCFYHFTIVNHFLLVCSVQGMVDLLSKSTNIIISYRFDLENRSCDNVS